MLLVGVYKNCGRFYYKEYLLLLVCICVRYLINVKVVVFIVYVGFMYELFFVFV